jgi:hypothetical protein
MLAVRNALSFPKYWQDKANEPVAPNAIRVVALGDSAMQAIGAAHPEEWGIRRADFARYFDAVGKAPYSGCIRSPKKGGTQVAHEFFKGSLAGYINSETVSKRSHPPRSELILRRSPRPVRSFR